ncbi:MAG: S9 family peptidase [Steroidobacteraceae bacterium]|jgi:dipeptidyl aminopeptidase/acylaminoacyl peptidase|nr:S9 family peptidase [Steroidobacteraceae bacterium]
MPLRSRFFVSLAAALGLALPAAAAAAAAGVDASAGAPAAASAPATAARALSHEGIWLMPRVGPPALSPDGRWAVISVTEPAYARREQKADLWLVAVDGSQPSRRLTATAAPETSLTWSDDGRRIAFVTKRERDTENQVYVLDVMGGGEAQRVTDAPPGARQPKFSPDGTRIAYVADAWPGAKDEADNRRLDRERDARRYEARVYEGFPVRHWDRWLDERQARVYVQSLDGGAPVDVLAGSALLREPGYSGRMDDDGTRLDPAWTPDGSGIVFVASVDRHRAAYAFTSTQLWLAPAGGGAEPRRLTAGEDSWHDPRFAADGRTLYAKRTARTDRVYNAEQLAALAWSGTPPDGGARAGAATGEWRVLTDAVDREVGSWGVAADGTVYFTAEDAGHEKLYVVPRGRPARLAHPLESGAYTSLQVATRSRAPVLVARWESAVNPAELVRIDPVRGRSALTSFAAQRAAALSWQPVEHFWFTAPNGRRVHNMLVKPPGFDPAKKYPLFVLIHGGPHIMWRDQFFLRWNYHLIAQGQGGHDGYVVLLTNYSGSTGFGEAFARHIQGDPLAGPADEINAAADEAIRRYSFVDGARQCAGGASYGGHLANWLQGTTTRYRCLVSHAGLVDLRSQWATSDSIYHREVNVGGPPWSDAPLWRTQSPLTYAEKFGTPTLVTIGEQDYRVPLNNQLEYWTVLQRLRVPSRLVVFPTENHWILDGENSRYFYGELDAWLAKHLH